MGPLEFGYQGLPRDPETGLIYFRNRYYDPELGRFITADPKGYTDGPSEYAFEGDDPANKRDPLGLLPDWLEALKIMVFGESIEKTKGSAQRTIQTAKESSRAASTHRPTMPEIEDDQSYHQAVADYQDGGRHAVGETFRKGGETARNAGETLLHGADVAARASLAKDLVVGGAKLAVGAAAAAVARDTAKRGAELLAEGSKAFEFVSDKYRDRVARSFAGDVAAERLTSDLVVYRHWGGHSLPTGSPWFSEKAYARPGAARRYLSLPNSNTAENVTAFRIPAGATIVRGKAASQQGEALFGDYAVGGGTQIYLTDPGLAVPIVR